MNVPSKPIYKKPRIRSRASLAALAILLTSCSSTQQPDEEKTEPQNRPQIVGRIASIPHGHSFVLIQSYGDWMVSAGTILTTRGAEERTANLLVTGEKLGQYAAADIQAGEVAVGDTVLLLPTVAPKPPPQPAVEENPDAGEPESL